MQILDKISVFPYNKDISLSNFSEDRFGSTTADYMMISLYFAVNRKATVLIGG